MSRWLPLVLAPLLCAAISCPPLPCVNASLVIGGKGPGRLLMGADQGPNSDTCPLNFGGIDISTSAALKANLWLTMPTNTLPAAIDIDPDGVSTTALPSAAGWQANAPVALPTFFVTHLSYRRDFLDWWFITGGAWGDCGPGATGWCYYVLVQPTGNGGFVMVKSGRVRHSDGAWCEIYWRTVQFDCALPYPQDRDPANCWLPQNSTQPYPEG